MCQNTEEKGILRLIRGMRKKIFFSLNSIYWVAIGKMGAWDFNPCWQAKINMAWEGLAFEIKRLGGGGNVNLEEALIKNWHFIGCFAAAQERARKMIFIKK